MRRALVVIAIGCACDAAASTAVSPLELALVTPGSGPLSRPTAIEECTPRLILAQRAIDREWSTVGDSSAAGLHVEGMRSEVAAATLSAAVPGAGQIYAGAASGYAFAAVEAASWVSYLLLNESGNDLRADSEAYAGAPEDSASAWSFDRWETTGGDADPLRALYTADREAFYDAIGSDERLTPGWVSPEAKTEYSDLRSSSNRRLEQARWTTGVIWVNHLIAAFDALRVVRFKNLDLAGNVQLKARGVWEHGRPGMRVTLVRRF